MAMDELKKKIIKLLIDKDQFEENIQFLMNEDSIFLDFSDWMKHNERGEEYTIPSKVRWLNFSQRIDDHPTYPYVLQFGVDQNESPNPRGAFILMKDATGDFVQVVRQDGSSGFVDELYKDEFSKFLQFIDKLDNERCHNVLLCEMRVSGVMSGLVNIEECMFSSDKVGMNADTFVVSISRNITEGEILVNDDNDKKIVIKENINGTIYVCSALHCSYITRDELLKSKWYILKFFDQDPEECSVSLDFLKRLKTNLENERRI